MTRRLILICVLALASSLLLAPPSQARDGSGLEVFDEGTYAGPYEDDDGECGFTFHVEGREWGRYRTYVVPQSDRQAFLGHTWYHWRETLTNPANGKKLYLSGDGYYREVSARRVEGTVWDFISIETGTPFVIRDARGRVIVKDYGRVVRKQRFDTLGDDVPGGEVIGESIIHKLTRGSFPSLAPDFDFCAIAAKYLGATPTPAVRQPAYLRGAGRSNSVGGR